MKHPSWNKPSAADRTVDMFCSAPTGFHQETTVEPEEPTVKVAETIEQSAKRWRATAMFTSEHLSKHFNEGLSEKSVFRITTKDNMMFLEKFSNDVSGKAYGWAGVMFRTDELYELTGVFVKASKELRAKEAR